MVVSTSRTDRRGRDRPSSDAPAVVWHDLECGSYRADLPLWLELAGRVANGGDGSIGGDWHGETPILDVGAGTGRVALELARAGHRVTALDRDLRLLEALSERAAGLTDGERAGGLAVETVCADARTFALARRDFALCLVAMQTLQLLGGAAGRGAFLRRAHAHLRAGGLLACALVIETEQFDARHDFAAPAPETARVGEQLYLSRATRVEVRAREIVLEYERVVLGPGADAEGHADDAADARTPQRADGRASITSGASTSRRAVVTLDRVSVPQLEREAYAAAGFRPEPVRSIAPTADHAGSEVAMLRA
jgi:SAM-dependent methyltransferase